MVQIKNINPLGSALVVANFGRVEFGAVVDLPKEVAEKLLAGKNFKKAGKPETQQKAAAKNAPK
jgi:hypothetical protein